MTSTPTSQLYSRRGLTLPDSSRVMSSKLPTSRLRRAAPSWISRLNVSRISGEPEALASAKAPAAAVMAEMGVRSSWEMELRSDLLNCSGSFDQAGLLWPWRPGGCDQAPSRP